MVDRPHLLLFPLFFPLPLLPLLEELLADEVRRVRARDVVERVGDEGPVLVGVVVGEGGVLALGDLQDVVDGVAARRQGGKRVDALVKMRFNMIKYKCNFGCGQKKRF